LKYYNEEQKERINSEFKDLANFFGYTNADPNNKFCFFNYGEDNDIQEYEGFKKHNENTLRYCIENQEKLASQVLQTYQSPEDEVKGALESLLIPAI
jgi:hypothetical protein